MPRTWHESSLFCIFRWRRQWIKTGHKNLRRDECKSTGEGAREFLGREEGLSGTLVCPSCSATETGYKLHDLSSLNSRDTVGKRQRH